MRQCALITACVALLFLVSGCDFFRTLAGRPTSAEIEAKRERLELAQQREAHARDSVDRARRDSVLRVRQAADSLHALDTLVSLGKYHKASSYRNIPQAKLRTRYAMVGGVFSNEDNAGRLKARYEAEGYEAYVLKYYSGLCAVLVGPCDKIADALGTYRATRSLPFRSDQSWILVNE